MGKGSKKRLCDAPPVVGGRRRRILIPLLRFRTAFHVGRLGEPGTPLDSFLVAILLGFANRFALRSNDDNRPRRVALACHLQKAVIPVVLSR